MSADELPKIPVTVLTGFLGSGKTTVLKHWIVQPELANTLVVINEFGQIGLDHRLVTQSEDSATVVMDSGCICCTIRTDLIQTLEQARWRFARQGKRQFDRVVIETTGLADPAPIMQTLATEPRITRHYRLQSVVTTVDLVLGQKTLTEHAEAAKQVAMADLLLLTKADLIDATPGTDDPLVARLEQLNPSVPTSVVSQGNAPVALLATIETADPADRWRQPKPGAGRFGIDTAGHDHAIGALSLVCAEPLSREAIEQWQQQVMIVLGADLFRLKAIVEVSGDDGPEWIVVQSVQHKAMPSASIPVHEPMSSQFVLIGRNLTFDRLAATLTDAMPLTEASSKQA